MNAFTLIHIPYIIQCQSKILVPKYIQNCFGKAIIVPTGNDERSFQMENINRSIQCSVDQCAFHCRDCDYCSLDKIHVGTHEPDPSAEQCTDCQSFSAKY